MRNVWLLDYRNQGESDHHDSFEMDDISKDIMRWMNRNHITMASIGGHGFGAKVATATAIGNMDRFTGVMCLDGGPIDNRYHEAYLELKKYVEKANEMELKHMDLADAKKRIDRFCKCP